MPGRLSTTATAAGLTGMAKAIGREFAGRGILINCVMVGTRPCEDTGAYAAGVAELLAWTSSDACRLSTDAIFDTSLGKAIW